MTQKEWARHAGNRMVTAAMLVCLLATAGCMTSQQAGASAAGDAESVSDPTIDGVERATAKCQVSACEP